MKAKEADFGSDDMKALTKLCLMAVCNFSDLRQLTTHSV